MEQYTKNAIGGYLQVPIADKTVTTELSGDFTLPDYQPEIKRLLRVTASILPPSKYVGGREAEFAGSVDYYVLYTGSDNELYCAPLTAEYRVEVPFDPTEIGEGGTDRQYLSDMTGDAVIVPDMISGRVTAPRKISIKCRLRTRAQIFGEMPMEDGFGEETNDVEVLHGKANAVRMLCGVGEKLPLSDEMIAENGGELRVISAEGRALVSEVSPANGAVNCRGDLYLKLLMCREDGGMPYSAMRKIPFSQSVPCEGVDAGCSVCAWGTVCDMGITVEDGKIGIDVGVILETAAMRGESVAYVKDIYSTSRKTQNEYKALRYSCAGAAFGGNFTLSDSKSLEEAGIGSPDVRVVDVIGTVYPEEQSFEGGRCVVSGKAKFTLLMEREGEYSSADLEMPFRYDAGAGNGMSAAICRGEVISVRARMDGERIGIDAEIGISGRAWDCAKLCMADSFGFGEEIRRAKGEFVLCYPSGEDTLWSVAKRYGATLSGLTEANGLSSEVSPDDHDSLDGVDYLVI